MLYSDGRGDVGEVMGMQGGVYTSRYSSSERDDLQVSEVNMMLRIELTMRKVNLSTASAYFLAGHRENVSNSDEALGTFLSF